MRLIKGFRLRTICGETILTPESVAQVNFNRIISLNASAAYLWQSVGDKEFTPDDLKRLLMERYEVEEAVAQRDAEKIARDWVEVGIAVE